MQWSQDRGLSFAEKSHELRGLELQLRDGLFEKQRLPISSRASCLCTDLPSAGLCPTASFQRHFGDLAGSTQAASKADVSQLVILSKFPKGVRIKQCVCVYLCMYMYVCICVSVYACVKALLAYRKSILVSSSALEDFLK